jgi:large subunit ribosomal protein L24
MPAPISLPPPVDAPKSPLEANPPGEALPQVPLPGRDPRRPPAKPKALGPRPPAVPSLATAPPPNPAAPVTSQHHVAPLPPPIDVKPAPGAMKLKPRPPLALTPQVANPPPRPALQNSN